eukprot:1724606-Rhodomonas_salina.1
MDEGMGGEWGVESRDTVEVVWGGCRGVASEPEAAAGMANRKSTALLLPWRYSDLIWCRSCGLRLGNRRW